MTLLRGFWLWLFLSSWKTCYHIFSSKFLVVFEKRWLSHFFFQLKNTAILGFTQSAVPQQGSLHGCHPFNTSDLLQEVPFLIQSLRSPQHIPVGTSKSVCHNCPPNPQNLRPQSSFWPNWYLIPRYLQYYITIVYQPQPLNQAYTITTHHTDYTLHHQP